MAEITKQKTFSAGDLDDMSVTRRVSFELQKGASVTELTSEVNIEVVDDTGGSKIEFDAIRVIDSTTLTSKEKTALRDILKKLYIEQRDRVLDKS